MALPKHYIIAFDCETDNIAPSSRPGSSKISELRFINFTVICAIIIDSDLLLQDATIDEIMSKSICRTWWRDIAEKGHCPITTLLALFDDAEAIVGYNCLEFDFPLIYRFYCMNLSDFDPTKTDPNKRYFSHRAKTFDVMTKIKDISGSYMSLNNALISNCIDQKSGDGKNAIRLWEQGNREELEEYCINDVDRTLRLACMGSLKMLKGGPNVVTPPLYSLKASVVTYRNFLINKH